LKDHRPVLKYAAAGGVVIDTSRTRVLVLVRPKRLGPDGTPEIRLPKGHIEPGESRRQAALREVSEEAGLPEPQILADLGQQIIRFEWKARHHIRDEFYYLMIARSEGQPSEPEQQFERLWLTWEEALSMLTFEAEREWVRRARIRSRSQTGA
jgi:8-oxo-dGTP pyrophosphatase MutT (NUDIX family)